MTLPPTPEGMPPLPKGLRGALALQSDWKEQEKVQALKQAIQKDLVENNNQTEEQDPQKEKSLQGSLTQLRKDMVR